MILEAGEVPPLALLKFFRQQTGLMVRLKPYERALKVIVNDDAGTASVLLETFDVHEGTTKTTFKKRGKRLLGYNREVGVWMMCGEMTLWDEDFVAVENVDRGTALTNKERTDKREWEGMAYRVGDRRTPLDNAARVAEGHTTPAMTRHWA